MKEKDENTQQLSLEETLAKQREQWVEDITKMNEMFKTLPNTNDMMNSIYSLRQKCVESYYGMNTLILKQTKEYKKLYSDMFNNIKLNGLNGMRYNTDQAINRAVETALEDRKEIIDLLTNHNNYIKETISSIDNIIYGITQKVKIQEILNSLKF